MEKTTVVLTLPEKVVQHFRQFATAGNRTLEEVLSETLAAHPLKWMTTKNCWPR